MSGATLEIHGSAYEIRPIDGRIAKPMFKRARVEQQRRLAHPYPGRTAAASWMRDDKLPSPQHVQEPAPGLCLEARYAAERTRVKQVGANAKALEKGREAIYGYRRRS